MTKNTEVKDAILALNPADDAHWNGSGQADLNVLKERLGRQVSAGERDDAGLTREEVAAAAKAKEGKTDDNGSGKAADETAGTQDAAKAADKTANSAPAASADKSTAKDRIKALMPDEVTAGMLVQAANGDAVKLLEAVVLAAGSERYHRNGPLLQHVQAYLANQKAIKEWQERADAKHDRLQAASDATVANSKKAG